MSAADAADADPHGRYERRQLRQSGDVETWSGWDRRLERPVTIRRAEAASETGQRLRMQAKALARVEHHGLLHIWDTYDEADHFAIVTEQLPKRLLTDELTAPDGSMQRLAPAEAVRIVIAVTEALAVLHSAGFAHGGPDARGIGWRAEVGWVIVDGPPTDDAVTIPATRRADLASIAVLAHRLLTGGAPQRRPDGTWELDPAVPDAIAPTLMRAISATDAWPDAPSMLLALRSVVDDLGAAERGRADRRSVWQAERQWLAPIGVLVAAAATLVGVATLIEQPVALDRGTMPATESTIADDDIEPALTAPPAATGDAPAATPTTLPMPTITQVSRVRIPLESITDFDPAGDDRVEHPERLVFINDGDPTTGWSTARYSTRDFGGLKDGVGLIVVLMGEELLPVSRIGIDSSTAGWSFEVYASRQRNRTLIDWGSPVASAADVTGSTTLDLPFADAAALLLWITDLGDELPNGGHRVTISRIDVDAAADTGQAPPGTDAVTP